MNALVRAPAQVVDREGLPVARVKHREVPVEDMDVQSVAATRKRIEKVAKRSGQPVIGLAFDAE